MDSLSLAYLTTARAACQIEDNAAPDLRVESQLITNLLAHLPQILQALCVWHGQTCANCKFYEANRAYAYCYARPPVINANGDSVRPKVTEHDLACELWIPDAETLEARLGLSGDLICEALRSYDAGGFEAISAELGLTY